MDAFKGKVAVITGAGRGIGRGIALRCAKEGMRIVLAGYSLPPLEKTAADCQALGADTLIVPTDVSQEEAVNNLCEKSYAHFSEVHLLVNNAGVAAPGSPLDISVDDWRWVMDVNFWGVLYGLKAFVPKMQAMGTEAHVVNVSSLNGILPGGSSYGVSKHAVVVLTESMYEDLVKKGSHVQVSVFCPGWVNTDFDGVARSRPERYQKAAHQLSEKGKEIWRRSLDGGISTEEAAEILFKGLTENRLYIGPKEFQAFARGLLEAAQKRVENMFKGDNPIF